MQVTDELLQTAEAAPEINMSAFWLHKERSQGRGPRYIRIGRKVFYRRSDLQEWLEQRYVETQETRDQS